MCWSNLVAADFRHRAYQHKPFSRQSISFQERVFRREVQGCFSSDITSQEYRMLFGPSIPNSTSCAAENNPGKFPVHITLNVLSQACNFVLKPQQDCKKEARLRSWLISAHISPLSEHQQSRTSESKSSSMTQTNMGGRAVTNCPMEAQLKISCALQLGNSGGLLQDLSEGSKAYIGIALLGRLALSSPGDFHISGAAR